MPTPPRTRAAGADPGPAGSRALPLALLLLALAGLGVAVDLWVIHVRAHAGAGPSFCDINEYVSCGKVALSRWSILLGVPLAAWGALAYLAVAGLSASALLRGRPTASWPAGILVVITGLMSAGAVVLAAISRLFIQALCVMCLASWALSFALLAASWLLARRAGGIRAALARDLAAVRERPLPVGTGALALGALAVGLLSFHPRPSARTVAARTPVGPPGSVVVYEYSDYQCPYCARMHEALKPLLAGRPDVRMVRRHFPLDSACNPKIKNAFHVGSCALARGGICAEAQGRFEAYDDAAFAAQESHVPLDDLARRAGLDLDAFHACLAAPDTEARLQADVHEGIAAGVHATPSYQHQGKLFSGELPPVLGNAEPGGAE